MGAMNGVIYMKDTQLVLDLYASIFLHRHVEIHKLLNDLIRAWREDTGMMDFHNENFMHWVKKLPEVQWRRIFPQEVQPRIWIL